ncbi:MAG: hypothetical protein JW863_21970, partial [Chitinispirillaceae bacterium]|nr:hypothetical protein [Chitinispirillaceae bacterium]
MFRKPFNRLPAAMLLGAALVTLSTALPTYTLKKITPDGVDITAELPAAICGTDIRCVFAFTTRPNRPFTVTATTADNRSITCSPGIAGWSGNCYLQWCSFSAQHVRAAGNSRRVSLTIRFSSPMYQVSEIGKAQFVQGVLRVPLTAPLGKQSSVLPTLPYKSGVRMEVSEDGVYELSGKMLRECGVSISRIPSRTYRLFNRDREVPLYFPNAHHTYLGDDDVLVFYGKKLMNPSGRPEMFSDINVYWLTWGGAVGARVAVVSGAR